MDDDATNSDLDAAIVDAERAAALRQMADEHVRQLDLNRQLREAEAEEDLQRQMADLERELGR